MSIILSLAVFHGESGQRGRQAQPARISGKDAVRIYGTRNRRPENGHKTGAPWFMTNSRCTRLGYPPGSRMTLRPEPYRHLVNEQIFGGLAALSEEARARGVEMSTLALAWVLHHPLMTAAIIGPRRPAHLDSALAALDLTLSAEDAARLAGFLVPEGQA
jgi:hypothetical protein